MQTEELNFDIRGMTCANCASRIEKGVGKLPGVKNVTVNFALETASVIPSPGSDLETTDIINKIENLGYGAFLKKELLSKNDFRETDYRDKKRKFIFSAILSLPLLYSMAGHISWLSFIPVPDILFNPWFQFAIATPVQFWIGGQFYIAAWGALRNRSANMDTLVVLGTSAAYFYSLYKTLFAQAHLHHAELYFETSSVLITLIIFGKLLESRAKGKTSRAIEKLITIRPKDACVIRNGKEEIIPAEEILIGDIILIRPGQSIPADGTVSEGNSFVDESMLTGESIPSGKKTGDYVHGGTTNQNGMLKVTAVKVGKDTLLSKIIRTVENAQNTKLPIQRMTDMVSEVFVPAVILISFSTFFLWYFFLSPGDITGALEKSIAVLVIACPCALGLATPTSIMAGSGRAAEAGILFKSGEHLEETGRIQSIVLDKTGTVTEGKPSLTELHALGGTEDELLQIAASLEKNSEHPIAAAISESASGKGVKILPVLNFQSTPGQGIRGSINGREYFAGSGYFLDQNLIAGSPNIENAKKLSGEGKTVIFIADKTKVLGYTSIADRIKETSFQAIGRLLKMGIEVTMLTGDNPGTAGQIAKEAGIPKYIAGVLPEDKANEIRRLQKEGKKVAMVGDGINDAPALATADIGMAMGTGTDIAIETADVTLITGNLNSIADAILISRATMRNIKQNLFWALAYNAIGIPVAAAGFLEPWIAGAAMSLSSVSVVLNALRLQWMRLK